MYSRTRPNQRCERRWKEGSRESRVGDGLAKQIVLCQHMCDCPLLHQRSGLQGENRGLGAAIPDDHHLGLGTTGVSHERHGRDRGRGLGPTYRRLYAWESLRGHEV